MKVGVLGTYVSGLVAGWVFRPAKRCSSQTKKMTGRCIVRTLCGAGYYTTGVPATRTGAKTGWCLAAYISASRYVSCASQRCRKMVLCYDCCRDYDRPASHPYPTKGLYSTAPLSLDLAPSIQAFACPFLASIANGRPRLCVGAETRKPQPGYACRDR